MTSGTMSRRNLLTDILPGIVATAFAMAPKEVDAATTVRPHRHMRSRGRRWGCWWERDSRWWHWGHRVCGWR
jgi:hypothetical protein